MSLPEDKSQFFPQKLFFGRTFPFPSLPYRPINYSQVILSSVNQTSFILKASLKNFNINPDTWENLAATRTAWRSEIRRGATQYKNIRIKKAEDKRAERKNRMYTESSIPNSTDFVCQTCQRHFRARIGLISHTRTHQPKN